MRSWVARGVEFTQEPIARYGSVDAGFRDPSGNGWKMIEARRGDRMSRPQLARQLHRALSVAFTIGVLANLVAMARKNQTVWVGMVGAGAADRAAGHRSLPVRRAVRRALARACAGPLTGGAIAVGT